MGDYFYKNEDLIDIDNEEWIDCVGYDGMYQVSNLGRIKSVERWRETRVGVGYYTKPKIRKQAIDEKYSSIRCYLCKDGFIKPHMVSRLVFFSFNYNINNLPEYYVVHKDNDFKNNKLENLKIGTRSEIVKLTIENDKLNHLKLGNPMLSKHRRANAVIKDGRISELKCICCEKVKPINLFRENRNACKECDYHKWYYKKSDTKQTKL